MNEKIPVSRKVPLLSCCFATSDTFGAFIMLNLIYIHTNAHVCIYMHTNIHVYKWVNMCVFSSVETFGMFLYIHDIML